VGAWAFKNENYLHSSVATLGFEGQMINIKYVYSSENYSPHLNSSRMDFFYLFRLFQQIWLLPSLKYFYRGIKLVFLT
jgi:hypothetical protein